MKSGYTLPVFATASAVSALFLLQKNQSFYSVEIDLINPPEIVHIPIEQISKLNHNIALAITRSDPGDNLDITRHTPIWAMVELITTNYTLFSDEQIIIKGGEGIGKNINTGQDAIYHYAHTLLRHNLSKYLQPNQQIIVTIILPEGKNLAQRTSNSAFGIVEGLSLLGTSGISQPLTVPDQLQFYQQELLLKASKFDTLVFCIGENGLDFAQKIGINPEQLIKTANWLGPLLVSAGLHKIKGILLFGYHGKLIKLAGGIFHTHHHLADGRLEIFTAHCANIGLNHTDIKQIFTSPTTESALKYLQKLDDQTGTNWVNQVYAEIARKIDQKATDYIYNHSQERVRVGSILFGSDRQILIKSENSTILMDKVCYNNPNI